jgi:hypothetical protein
MRETTMRLIYATGGARAITGRPVTEAEHYAAAVWLGRGAEYVARWHDEATREKDNHAGTTAAPTSDPAGWVW